MAKISVNDQYIVNGRLNIRRFKDEEGNILVEGTFATHLYFEEIDTLDCYRYLIKDIEVVEEIFAPDDFDIIYNFTAKSIENKFGMSDLDTESIQEIEKKIYGAEGYVLNTLLENLAKEEEDNTNE